jgi:hypothetical protein
MTLLFAGRNRIIMIHQVMRLTTDANPAEPVANFHRRSSFVLAPAAAGLSSNRISLFIVWSGDFSLFGKSCLFAQSRFAVEILHAETNINQNQPALEPDRTMVPSRPCAGEPEPPSNRLIPT